MGVFIRLQSWLLLASVVSVGLCQYSLPGGYIPPGETSGPPEYKKCPPQVTKYDEKVSYVVRTVEVPVVRATTEVKLITSVVTRYQPTVSYRTVTVTKVVPSTVITTVTATTATVAVVTQKKVAPDVTKTSVTTTTSYRVVYRDVTSQELRTIPVVTTDLRTVTSTTTLTVTYSLPPPVYVTEFVSRPVPGPTVTSTQVVTSTTATTIYLPPKTRYVEKIQSQSKLTTVTSFAPGVTNTVTQTEYVPSQVIVTSTKFVPSVVYDSRTEYQRVLSTVFSPTVLTIPFTTTVYTPRYDESTVTKTVTSAVPKTEYYEIVESQVTTKPATTRLVTKDVTVRSTVTVSQPPVTSITTVTRRVPLKITSVLTSTRIIEKVVTKTVDKCGYKYPEPGNPVNLRG